MDSRSFIRSFVCPSVHLFVSHTPYLENPASDFDDFCTKLHLDESKKCSKRIFGISQKSPQFGPKEARLVFLVSPHRSWDLWFILCSRVHPSARETSQNLFIGVFIFGFLILRKLHFRILLEKSRWPFWSILVKNGHFWPKIDAWPFS